MRSFAVCHSSCWLRPKLKQISRFFLIILHSLQVLPYRSRGAELEPEHAWLSDCHCVHGITTTFLRHWQGRWSVQYILSFKILTFLMYVHSSTKQVPQTIVYYKKNVLYLKIPECESGQHFICQFLNSHKHLLSQPISASQPSNWTICNTDEQKCMCSLWPVTKAVSVQYRYPQSL